MSDFIAWLAGTQASAVVQNVSWIIPAVQCFHILCVSVAMASVLLLDLRIVGLTGQGENLSAYAGRYRPLVWMALCGLLVSGLILIVGEPNRDLDNFTFWLKMGLVAAAAMLTMVGGPRSADRPKPAIRALALLSLACWIGAVICGRWIAYTYMN